MSRNPSEITLVTVESEVTIENVRTWWKSEENLMIEFLDETQRKFPITATVVQSNNSR
jgi:hypothetical protein